VTTSRQPQLSNSETHVLLSWIRFVTSNPFRRFEPAFGLQKGMTGGMDPPSRLSGSPLPSETETVTESRRWVSLSKGRMPGVVDPAGGGLAEGRAGFRHAGGNGIYPMEPSDGEKHAKQHSWTGQSCPTNRRKTVNHRRACSSILLTGRDRIPPPPVSSSGTSIRTLYTVQVLFRTIFNLCRALLVVTFFREGP